VTTSGVTLLTSLSRGPTRGFVEPPKQLCHEFNRVCLQSTAVVDKLDYVETPPAAFDVAHGGLRATEEGSDCRLSQARAGSRFL
jgi:hypothetical protein